MDHRLMNEVPDVILRSGDGQEYKAHKYLLSLASPVFSTMFTLPQGSESPSSPSNRDGLPVVDMLGDNGKVLQRLLEMCNPTYLHEEKPVKTLDEWKEVFAMAQKFEMKGVGYYLRRNPGWFAEKEPLRVVSLAVQSKNAAIARKAASSCLAVPFKDWKVFPEMESITGGDLQGLHNYYIKCGESAAAIVKTCDERLCHCVGFHCVECAASNRSFSHWDTAAVGCTEYDVELEDQEHSGAIRLWWWQYAEGLCRALEEKPKEKR
ncbi:hypothetical protein SERLA73DRAFT_163832 [Serpula lacrymans var. lacrymans S7.3]|uniref:BTB domain-containing protein n=2 Tax=Serpula lacrymans var. lacrymans TaxID=341189 RepID=F8QFQ7_SERL3|nr:uncharacterized protein SERLADRAFT_413095 [Serpula lacrymans var. lacrymans S7.9]EGN92891.1 hypothetical protein SERLA73DRAFT_163832 [Serpula lacrymans var. lacrymans S7.3]EGO29721.1 hypothetical protein SERLADRAFT_413095 [Serpula lacrymans var. lacrymans S7.9]